MSIPHPGRKWLLTLVLLGCSRSPQRVANERGIYLGGQLNAFTACGESKVLWVEGSEASLKALKAGGPLITGIGVRPVYIEVVGHVMRRRTQAEYDGTLQVDTVLAVRARRPADCGLPKGAKFEDPRDDP